MAGHGKRCVPPPFYCVPTLTRPQFPIGMGTGAVYVTLAGIKQHPGHVLTIIETIFYFLNMALFLLNTSTLLLQFISASDRFRLLHTILMP